MFINKISTIGRTYRHVQRYRQILTVLFKYGFGDLVESLKIEKYVEIGLQIISLKRGEKIETLSRAERVRKAIEDLGPTFIKMGQILSTRPNVLPAEFIRELSKLQDDVPPFAFDEARRIVESELKAPLESLFASFEERPLAAASLGQVHRALLLGGEEVAVKVRRPNIRKTITVDLEIMFHLAGLMEKHLEGWKDQRPTAVVEEFGRTIERELDYTIEASHIDRFARQFKGDPTVHVPEVHRGLTTSRVLTMEYVEGIRATELTLLEKEGLDRRKLARRGAVLLMKQIFVHGFFHADPHPGNVLFLPDHVICFLDFGMMGRIGRRKREDFADLVTAIVRRNETKAAEALLRLSTPGEGLDEDLLKREVSEFMDLHFHRPLKELELGKLLLQFLEMLSRHHLGIAPDLFLMLKALSTVEGLGRSLDPDFDITKEAAPFLRRIQAERLDPRRFAGDMAESGSELFRLLKEAPRELHAMIRQAKHGKIRMEFKHRGLEPMSAAYDRASSRLAFAIVLASLVVGSALIVLSGIPPKWCEIPVIGLVGFLIAGIMGFWLLVSILRHGKM